MKSRTRRSCGTDSPEFSFGVAPGSRRSVEGDRESFSVRILYSRRMRHIRQQGVARTRPPSLVMKHQIRISCFARVQIGAEPVSQRFPVEAQAKFAYRLHVVRIAPVDPHLCWDKTDVTRPLLFQGSGAMVISGGHLTSAAYLREHNCESVLRTRQTVAPGTAWVVEMLQVTNRLCPEGSKSAVRRLHTVRRTKLKRVRSLRNLHLGFRPSFCGSSLLAFSSTGSQPVQAILGSF